MVDLGTTSVKKLCALSLCYTTLHFYWGPLIFYAHNYQSEEEVFNFGHTCVLINVQVSDFEGNTYFLTVFQTVIF